MKLTRELIKPFLATGSPDEIAENPALLDVLKKVTMVEGCTEEKLAIDYLVLFFKQEKLVEILVKINRFDILVGKKLEGDLLLKGKYLEEIYDTIVKKFPTDCQPRMMARFCEYGQRDFLVKKNAWDGIACCKAEADFLIAQDKTHLLIYHSITMQAKIAFGYVLTLDIKLMDKIYQAKGIAPFEIAYKMAISSNQSGICQTILNFMFKKEEYDFLYNRQGLWERVEVLIFQGGYIQRTAPALYFYQYYIDKNDLKGAKKIKEIFSVFSKTYWLLGSKKWRGKTINELRQEFG